MQTTNSKERQEQSTTILFNLDYTEGDTQEKNNASEMMELVVSEEGDDEGEIRGLKE